MKETTDRRDKLAIHRAIEAYGRGTINRRTLVKTLAAASVALGGARFAAPRATASPLARRIVQESTPPAEVGTWLSDVAGQFRGTTIRVVSEETPPSRAIINLMEEQFIQPTGINVEWEVLPLAQVLSRVSVDAAGQLGSNDIYYFDQAWVGRFINDTSDPRERLEQQPDLAYPNYNIDDFLAPLVRNIATYQDRMIGFPCDVPIFMYFYRQDIYEELGLQPATTLAQYLDNARAINEDRSAQGTYGTVGQMQSGHYALNCEMTAWLWSHGGSIFNADGQCVINDAQGIAGLDYLRQLQRYMPAAVTTYDWGGQATAIQQGQGGQVVTWGEDFPGWEDPTQSAVSGLMTPALLPANVALRPADQCGYEEQPEMGHQGGSTYCLSRYSRNQDAAWCFLQWATSAETQTLASIIGGGASPMRQSTFDDPRVQEMAQVGVAGTTRHFPAMYEVITTRMGTEPHLPQWPQLATDVIAVELGRMTTSDVATQQAADTIAEQVNAVVAG